ncbi:MAG: hypothetical protein OHK006_16510 [Thermodesulfovibrionales bacterium]
MVLVDTSVLIDFLGSADNGGTEAFQTVIDSGVPYGITPFTYMEALQGVRTERDFEHDLFLLHNDRDFDNIANVVKLKIFSK